MVHLDGKDFYLGKHESAESRRRYDRLIAEWLAGGRRLVGASSVTVEELAAAFWDHAKGYYVKGGRPTSELGNFRTVLRMLLALYEDLPVREFSPIRLKAVREAMVKRGWRR